MGDLRAQQSSSIGPAAAMWRYAGIFLGVYGSFSIALGILVNVFGMKRPSWFGILAMVLAAHCVGWIFARRHRRLFELNERRRLTAMCVAVALAFEGLGYVGYPEYFQGLPVRWLIGLFAFAIGLDALVIWIAFKYPVARSMTRQLAKQATMSLGPRE